MSASPVFIIGAVLFGRGFALFANGGVRDSARLRVMGVL